MEAELISLLALLVAVIALIRSIALGRSQAEIKFAQQRSSLRLDVHRASLALDELTTCIRRSCPAEDAHPALSMLVSTAEGLIEIYRMLDKPTPGLWIVPTQITSNYNDIATRIAEFMGVLDAARAALQSSDYERLMQAVEGLHTRVWSGVTEPSPSESRLDA